MLQLIEDLPPDVLGVTATGKVTHEDYRTTLIPKAEAMLANGPINMLYVVGKDCTGFELEALWDDAGFGMKHWRDFSRIAVVTEHAWLRSAIGMFTPFIRGEVRLFDLEGLPAAKAWIAAPKPDGA